MSLDRNKQQILNDSNYLKIFNPPNLGTIASLIENEVVKLDPHWKQKLQRINNIVEFRSKLGEMKNFGSLGNDAQQYDIFHYLMMNPQIQKQIAPPPLNYIYHGTSAAFHSSIQILGMDSSKNEEINQGAYEVRSGGACGTSSYTDASRFATQTHNKIRTSDEVSLQKIKEQIPGFDVNQSCSVVYRWESKVSLPYGKVVTTPAVPSSKLEFSIDHIHWYPADKFNLKNVDGQVQVLPNFQHPEIARLDQQLEVKTRIINKLENEILNNKKFPSHWKKLYHEINGNSDYQPPESMKPKMREMVALFSAIRDLKQNNDISKNPALYQIIKSQINKTIDISNQAHQNKRFKLKETSIVSTILQNYSSNDNMSENIAKIFSTQQSIQKKFPNDAKFSNLINGLIQINNDIQKQITNSDKTIELDSLLTRLKNIYSKVNRISETSLDTKQKSELETVKNDLNLTSRKLTSKISTLKESLQEMKHTSKLPGKL